MSVERDESHAPLCGDTSSSWLVRPDAFVVALLLLAVAMRLILWLGGWSPLDGDEAIIGLMGRHLAEGRGISTWFWGQHYMGTLDVPGIALLMFLGGDEWRASVWPLRGAAILYLLALMWLHGRLAGRLAGPIAERYTLLLLAIGPFAWLDYSMRMRCASLMMAVGALILHLTLDMIDRRSPITFRSVFVLGLITGIAWWYYPLVVIYMLTAFAMVMCFRPSMVPEILGTTLPGNRAAWPGFLCRIAMIAGLSVATIWLALIASGSGNSLARDVGSYRPLIAPALMLIAIISSVLLVWDGAGGSRRKLFVPVPSAPFLGGILGILLGMSPALQYFYRLHEVPLVDLGRLDPGVAIEGFRAVMFLELPVILGIIQPSFDSHVSTVGLRGLAVFLFFTLLIYAGLRLVLSAETGIRRLIFIAVGLVLAVIAFNSLSTRSGESLIPRFLIPVMGGLAMAFGATMAMLIVGRPQRIQWATAVGASLVLGAAAVSELRLWPRESMDIASGHRRHVAEIARHLTEAANGRRAGVRLDFVDTHVNHSVLMAYELQYASLARIRVSPGSLIDRPYGHLEDPPADAPRFTAIDQAALDYLATYFGITESDLFDPEARRSAMSFGAWMLYPGTPAQAHAQLRRRGDPRRMVFRPDGTMVLMDRSPSGAFVPHQTPMTLPPILSITQ